MHNIGLVYFNKGRFTDALKYYERCLSIQENAKGKNSLECTLTLNNIGSVYFNVERYNEALGYY
jgi:tetratricopeptide (TPR) repeat protein